MNTSDIKLDSMTIATMDDDEQSGGIDLDFVHHVQIQAWLYVTPILLGLGSVGNVLILLVLRR